MIKPILILLLLLLLQQVLKYHESVRLMNLLKIDIFCVQFLIVQLHNLLYVKARED